ncbi:MAG TPA: DUF1554 domain-containing protein, partial [Myxococcales bacterium]|nr:DUF1554 domain-containing protein [Myxococcales bacterium]
PQYVTVTGVNDDYDDTVDPQPWIVRPGRTASADPNYNGLTAPDVAGDNYDDDSPGVSFNPGSPYPPPRENAGSIQVMVTLQTHPRGQITLRPTSSDPATMTVSPSTLDLDGSNWSTGVPMTVTPVDNQVRGGDTTAYVNFAPLTATAQDPGYQNLFVYPFTVPVEDDERVIFTLTDPVNGDMHDPGDPLYANPDALCRADPKASAELLNSSPMAMLVSPGPYFLRIASATANNGDGQYDWVLGAGYNYLSESKTGPVMGRANSRRLLDFPLARPLSATGDYWTGLKADWTTDATVTCSDWISTGSMGQTGSSTATGSGAISAGTLPCASNRYLLCVEQ